MPVIINEVEVIAPPPSPQTTRTENPVSVRPTGPTPEDVYWATRKLVERRLRIHAR